jgi:MFS family permease
VVDRAGARRPGAKFAALTLLCIVAAAVLALAFGASRLGLVLSPQAQFGLVALGGFVMTCTVGPVSAIVIDVIHPGVRATGCSVLSLFQNLLGLAAGPVLAGALSDVWGLEPALAAIPAFSLLAAVAFVIAARSYEADRQRATELPDELADVAPVVSGATA